MATASSQTAAQKPAKTFVQPWFFTGMAIVMIVVSLAGFMPSIMSPAGRRAPLTLLAVAHGIVFFAWLLLFLTQSLLVAKGHVRWHRRLGVTSLALLAIMVPLAFETTMAMVRRGYDLSGDQHIDPHPNVVGGMDGSTAAVFNLPGLFIFAVLAVAALLFRRRPEIHKRLMLYANIELMGPPITHCLGHFPSLVLTPATVLIPFTIFLLAGVGRDYLVAKRIHPLTAVLAFGLFAALPLQGAIIGPSQAWHNFVAWLAR